MLRVSALLGVLLLIACGDDGRVAPSDVPTADMGPVPSADGGDTGEGDAFVPTSPLVDPACVDGMYSEVLPAVDADISDLTWAGDVGAYVDAFLDRRYPVGAALVRGGRTNTDYGQDCDVLYAGSPSSAGDVIDRMNTIVHECGHFYDGELSTFTDNTYVVTPTQQISCSRGDATDRGGDTFARSRINDDEYAALRPACPSGSSGPDCDFYADTYLDGDPDNGNFEGGDQGFNMLIEEAFQYVNSLATSWSVLDQSPPGRSTTARDGILTFLWYVERYLRMARLDFPGAYERLSGDACWRDAILTLWGRAWLYLEATTGMDGLSIHGDALETLVLDTDLLAEIERIRAAHGC
tara:strand:- start:699 stop:1754 length:1056 start_codon:yes stop_codon:yes gene_type:complete